MRRKPRTEIGVNSCLVASCHRVGVMWLLLPPEVGINRHGLIIVGRSWFQIRCDILTAVPVSERNFDADLSGPECKFYYTANAKTDSIRTAFDYTELISGV